MSDVEVVAIGARTPVGLTAESTAAAVRAGISRYAEFPFCDAKGEPVVAAADARLKPELEGRERLIPLVKSVLNEVSAKLAQGERFEGNVRLLLALPEARPGFSDKDATWVAETVRSSFRSKEFEVTVELAGRGHAGTIRAFETVLEACQSERSTLFLVTGIDSYHHVQTFEWLEKNKRFAQEGIRGGFAPGEGAACIAIASSDLRARLRLPRLAVIRGAATAHESRLRESESGSFGAGMSKAVNDAVASLDLPREGIDALYCDINGERYRSEEWGFVALKTPLVWKSYLYEAPGDSWGDVGAAFGTLATVLTVQSYARQYSRGPRALVMAGSESGLRGAMVLQDPRFA